MSLKSSLFTAATLVGPDGIRRWFHRFLICLPVALCAPVSSTADENSTTTTPFINDHGKTESKNLSYGVTLREAYDSNVNSSEDHPISSFATTVSPNVKFTYSRPNTDIAINYSYGITYYDRPPSSNSDNIDQSHDFTLSIAHDFSPRLRMALSDEFHPGFEPQIDQGDRQFNGNYIQNNAIMAPTYQISDRLSLTTTLRHFFISYDEAASAAFLDRQTMEGNVALRYTLRPTTAVGINTGVSRSDYSGLDRSSTAESLGFFIDHSFSPRFSVSLNAGGEVRFYDVESDSQFNPVIRASANYVISPRTTAALSFTAQAQPTEVLQYLQQTSYSTTLGLSHQFTSRLLGSANLSYIPAEYDSSLVTPVQNLRYTFKDVINNGKAVTSEEDTVVVNFSLAYQFSLHLRAEIGYSHLSVNSDFTGRTFDRDIGYMQLSLGF